MKDPAYLFYSQDFYTGVATMNFEDRGKYITLLCLMHQQGRMTEETIRFVVGSVSVILKSKFKVDENGFWYNERLEKEIEKRKNFIESRASNGKLGGRPKKEEKPLAKPNAEPLGKPKQNLPENENEIVIEDIKKEGGVGEEKKYSGFIESLSESAKEIYIEFYKTKVGVYPEGFIDDDIKSLLIKITGSMKSGGEQLHNQSVMDNFSGLLNKLPKFWLSKLNIKSINNNYDSIIAEIRTKSGTNSTNTMQDILAARKRQREADAANG